MSFKIKPGQTWTTAHPRDISYGYELRVHKVMGDIVTGFDTWYNSKFRDKASLILAFYMPKNLELRAKFDRSKLRGKN